MRVLAVMCLVAATAAFPISASAQEASTTRIETRPFYGATVTLEAGVRVFRPLPPHSKVVINPGGKTPVNLGFEESRWTSYNYNNNTNQNAPAFERVPRFEDNEPVDGFVDGFRHRGRRGPPQAPLLGRGSRR